MQTEPSVVGVGVVRKEVVEMEVVERGEVVKG